MQLGFSIIAIAEYRCENTNTNASLACIYCIYIYIWSRVCWLSIDVGYMWVELCCCSARDTDVLLLLLLLGCPRARMPITTHSRNNQRNNVQYIRTFVHWKESCARRHAYIDAMDDVY